MPRASKDKQASKQKLIDIRERYKKAVEADQDNRRDAMDDMKFVYEPGAQWDDNVRAERGNRPTYEFNKVRVSVKRVVNDMRANRPSGKVRGVEQGDKELAGIYEGLIRNIWNTSDGDTIIDQAAEYQVAAGMGAWRISVDYASEDAWEQDIRLEIIRNPFLLYADPACQDFLKRDARFWFLTTKIPKEEFEARWPKKSRVDFSDEVEFDDEDTWDDGERVRVVEYWYKEPVEKTIVLLSDGRTVDAAEIEADPSLFEGLQIVKERPLVTHRIKMCLASGDAILEEADWAGKEFPFVLIYGENLLIDGENRWFGLTRYSKDAQKAYNFSRTLAIEAVAKAPQAKWWATPKKAEGLEQQWAEAHKKNLPFMLYNPDPEDPGPPIRTVGLDVPPALVNEMEFSSEDIKAVTGIFDAGLGARSNETTGIAIRQRQSQGEIVTFNYMDNLSKGIRRTWEILIDLIPKVYDTHRVMRILGTDGAEDYVEINKPGPGGEVLNDVTRGKYDVTVTVGPSFATQRQEAAEIYMSLAQGQPEIMGVAGDLIFKSMDLPYAEDIAMRLKALLPPQIQQLEGEGKEMPPEVMAVMAQATQAMQMVEQQAQALEQQRMELESDAAQNDQDKAELKELAASIKVDYHKMVADIIKREAEIQIAEAEAKTEAEVRAANNERDAANEAAQQAVNEIRAQSDEFIRRVYEMLTAEVRPDSAA